MNSRSNALTLVLFLSRLAIGYACDAPENRARKLLDEGYLDECLKLVQVIEERTPEVVLLEAEALVGLNRYDDAISVVTPLITAECSVEARFVRGRCEYELHRYSKSVVDLDVFLQQHPEHGAALYYRGLCSLYLGRHSEAMRQLKRGIGRDSFPEEGYLVLATLLLQSHNAGEAENVVTTLIQKSPSNAGAYYYRAAARRALSQRDLMLEDLRKLVQVDPQQLGGYRTGWQENGRRIDEASRRHGEEQVRRLLEDRPAIAPFVATDNPIYRFTVARFSGSGLANRMFWDPSLPAEGFLADHVPPRATVPGRIRVRATDPESEAPWSAESQTAHLLYELFNAESASALASLVNHSRRGFLTRDGFIYEAAKLEYQACLRLRAFYLDVVEPWGRCHAMVTNADNWFGFVPPAFEQRFRQFGDRSRYPWSNFGSYYDANILGARNARRNGDESGEENAIAEP